MKKESRYLFYVTLIFFGVIIGVILTTELNFHQTSYAEKQNRFINENFSFDSSPDDSNKIKANDNLSNAFIEVNKKVTPSVVGIRAVRKVTLSELRRYHDKDNKEFWDFFNNRLNPFRQPQEYRQGASGSGIIVHKDGYILTNTHVVAGASQLEVTMFDNRRFPAHIVGVDSLTEVAVVKIKADDLPVARMGNSSNVEVGQWVLAIGNPLELRFTITAGIVSAIGRQMQIIGDNFGIENFIQTDAVINPGNSGGALVNLNGEVIGVNTAIATRTGYYEGYGFAIPINLAKAVMEDLVRSGRVIRAYLGISMMPMDYKKAKAYGMEKVEGVFIDNILPDGPAGSAGLLEEDILLAIDDVDVNRTNQVQTLIAEKEPGQKINLLIYRNGQEITVPVTLQEREHSGSVPVAVSEEENEPDNLGLEVKNLNRSEARELGLEDTKGVLVTDVKSYSMAFDAGLYTGAVITKVNDQPIDNEDDFWDVINNMKSGDVAILMVQRGSAHNHLFLEIP